MATSFRIDALQECNLTVASHTHDSNEEIVALIRRPGATGWVQTTGRVSLVSDFDPTKGAVLAAELIVDSTTSIHVRRAGSRWRSWTYTETEAGTQYRAETVHRLGIGAVHQLSYRIYWHKSLPTAFDAAGIEEWRPRIARLAALELKQENAR